MRRPNCKLGCCAECDLFDKYDDFSNSFIGNHLCENSCYHNKFDCDECELKEE